MIKSMIFLILVVLLSYISTTSAESLPSHYPSKFTWSGIVENIAGNKIIISDREFLLNKNVSVHRLQKYNSTINDLKSGMIVGCDISSTNTLVSIWELPNQFGESSGSSLSRGLK